jgi:hypothetical protein
MSDAMRTVMIGELGVFLYITLPLVVLMSLVYLIYIICSKGK